MGEKTFADIAAEMEGDALVMAGARRSDYASRMAFRGPAPSSSTEAVKQINEELESSSLKCARECR